MEPLIAGKPLRLLLDSGSDWTIVSKVNWISLGSPRLTACEEQAVSASGDPVKILGKFTARLKLHGREGTGSCYVADSQLNVLGSDWMESLGLWNVPISSVCNSVEAASMNEELKGKFPQLFELGLGRCNKMKASLQLKPDSKPVFRRKRPVPFAAVEPIEKELKRLQLQGVIEPVSYSQYAAPLVVVKKKDGRIRICADYSTGLNDTLEPNQYPLPTPEEIFAKLSRFRVFSKIDLSDAFLQIELDDNAKQMLTINTHCGLFQVNRVQPGIKTAPGMFQQLMDTMMAGAEGASPYMDDFIVGGVDGDDHRKNLFEVLRRIQDYGFRLRLEKCSFAQKKIEFLGHVVDSAGIRPDPAKVEMLKAIPAPTNVQQLQAFLGVVTWYGKFIPHLKDLRGPLDQLLCKDTDFVWDQMRQEAFEKLKTVFATDLELTHYDPSKKIIVAADASCYGMGGALLHEMSDGTKRPVMYVASSFNKAEKNYPQVQREALALTFAVKKFHRYIYGRRFELQTDHKPLLAIFGSKSGIPVYTASRLQRYALTLLAYDFSIRYIDTKSFAYADFVSRLIAKQEIPDEEVVIAATSSWGAVNVKNIHAPSRLSGKVNVKNSSAPGDVRRASVKNENARNPNVFQTAGIRSLVPENGFVSCFAIDTAKLLPITFEALQAETQKDDTLRRLMIYLGSRWPRQQKEIEDGEAAKFFVLRNSLIVIKGCVFYGDRIVVPARYRLAVLKTMHEGHPGTARTKLLARSRVYWPGIDADIEKMVKSCDDCAVNAKTPIKCTLQSWSIPEKPWSRIHIDYAGPIKSFFYLVIVDAYSNWPEVFKMTSTTSQRTIDCLEDAFSRHGLCDTIVSDNGPQFTSSQFKEFCEANGIAHIRTAPFHPQSNGRAERFVDVLTTGMKKLEKSGDIDHILRKFLMCYRSTPSYALGEKSPSQLINNRVMKTKLDLLKPSFEHRVVRNETMEAQFNVRHGAKWKEFSLGEDVFVKVFVNNVWKWTPGKIVERCGAVNYFVLTQGPSGGRRVKSHANQMKRRFNIIESGDNPLLDEFDIATPKKVEVEPQVVPESAAEEDEFEDAEEGGDVEQAPSQELQTAAAPDLEPVLRRSARTNAGTRPSWTSNFDMNL